MKRFFSALAFLTILPVNGRTPKEGESLSESVLYFLPIGALIGAALAALDYGLHFVLPPWPAAALIVIAMAVVSGGLHMDGLSDTADAFLSGASRDRALEIMKDSRCGPMGVLAVVSVFSMKLTALGSIAPDARLVAVFLAPLAGRCAMALALSHEPYIRGSNGLGTAFTSGIPRSYGFWAAGFLIFFCLLSGRDMGMVILLVCAVVILSFTSYSRKKIGGMTGDTYGALCELTEAAALLAAVAHLAGGAA